MKETKNERTASRRSTLCGALAFTLAGGLVAGCEGEPAGNGPVLSGSSAGDAEEMVPVAALNFPSGQSIEFFDLGNGALISETGPAGMPQMWKGDAKIEPDALLNVWSRFSPKAAPPETLRKLHARLMNVPRTRAPRKLPQTESSQTPYQPVASGLPEGTVAAPQGCNNGCCDETWLKTFIECGERGDYHWYHPAAGKSSAKADDAFHFRGMVCAAVGPSSHRFHLEGKRDVTVTLQEGRYRTIGATGSFFDDPNIGSYVNERGPQNRHAHCGVVVF